MSKFDWKKHGKRRERQFLDTFQFHFDEIKHASIELNSEDPPDGIIKIGAKKIGVELTELRWEEDADGALKQSQESISKISVFRAQQEYEKLSLPPIHVHVSFNDSYGYNKDVSGEVLRTSEKKEFESCIFRVVKENQENVVDGSTVEILKYDSKGIQILHDKIIRISMARFEGLTENCWNVGGGGTIPQLTWQKVQDVIDVKNQKLDNYKLKYDENWLILIEGIVMSGYFKIAEEVINKRYSTKFNRTFVLRSFDGDVIELKCMNRIY